MFPIDDFVAFCGSEAAIPQTCGSSRFIWNLSRIPRVISLGEKFWQFEIELQPWFPYVILKIDLESFSEASYDISPSSSHINIIFLTGEMSQLLLLIL